MSKRAGKKIISESEVDAVIDEVSKTEREQDYMRTGRTQKGYAPPEVKSCSSRLTEMMKDYARGNGGLWPYF